MKLFKRKYKHDNELYHEERLTFEEASALAEFIVDNDRALTVLSVEEYEYFDDECIPPQHGKAWRIVVQYAKIDEKGNYVYELDGEHLRPVKVETSIEFRSQYYHTPVRYPWGW